MSDAVETTFAALFWTVTTRVAALIVLLVLAMAVAGGYGSVHNQISYTVSEEYFTHFKFQQFRIDPQYHNRLGAAAVGFRASWWMGIPIGLVLGAMSWLHDGFLRMVREGLIAFGVVATTALTVGALGLGYGLVATADKPELFHRNWTRIAHRRAFSCAGAMHNASYLGGGLGMLVGATWMIRRRARRHGTQSGSLSASCPS
jgi:hypothetical protein